MANHAEPSIGRNRKPCPVLPGARTQRQTGRSTRQERLNPRRLHVARLLRLDEVVPVRIPTPAEEAAHDLVRAREASRQDLMQARHRLSKLLLRHEVVYSAGRAWNQMHDRWLRLQRLDSAAA